MEKTASPSSIGKQQQHSSSTLVLGDATVFDAPTPPLALWFTGGTSRSMAMTEHVSDTVQCDAVQYSTL